MLSVAALRRSWIAAPETGTAVPFVAVAGLGAMLVLSAGPLYGLAYGLSLRTRLTVSAADTVGIVAGAYHRFVRRATPDAVDDAVTRFVWGR